MIEGAGGEILASFYSTFPPGLTEAGICTNTNLATVLGKKLSPPSNSQLPALLLCPQPPGRGILLVPGHLRESKPSPLCSGAAFPAPQLQPMEWMPFLPTASVRQAQGSGQDPSPSPLSGDS